MDIWEEVYRKAKEQYHPEDVSPFIYAHHVVCALESENGEILVDYETAVTVRLSELLPAWWGTGRYN